MLKICDSVAPLVMILRTRVRKANLFGYISQIKKIFVLFDRSSIRGVIIKADFLGDPCLCTAGLTKAKKI